MESASVCVCVMGRGREDHSEIQTMAQWGRGRGGDEEESAGLQKFQKHKKQTKQERPPGQIFDWLFPVPQLLNASSNYFA